MTIHDVKDRVLRHYILKKAKQLPSKVEEINTDSTESFNESTEENTDDNTPHTEDETQEEYITSNNYIDNEPRSSKQQKNQISFNTESQSSSNRTTSECNDNDNDYNPILSDLSSSEDEVEKVKQNITNVYKKQKQESTEKDLSKYIIEFDQWMKSADGGAHEQGQYGRNIQKLMQTIGKYSTNFTKNNILNTFITPMFDQVTSNQMSAERMYQQLNALSHFLNYLKKSAHNRFVYTQSYAELCISLPDWTKSVNKLIKKQRSTRMVKQLKERLLPAHTQAYIKSDHVKNSIKLLQQYSKLNVDPGAEIYCKVRNYIILRLMMLENCSRPLPICNLQFSHIDSMEENIDGDFSLFVDKHKTATTHGAAQIVVPSDLLDIFNNYISIRRNLKRAPSKSNDYVFVTYNSDNTSHQMSSSLIDKCIKKEFADAGVEYKYNLTATKIRKLVSTEVRMKEPQHAPIIAKQLLHLETTQEKNYLLIDKSQNSFTANKIIRQITCGNDSSSKQQSLNLNMPDTYENTTNNEICDLQNNNCNLVQNNISQADTPMTQQQKFIPDTHISVSDTTNKRFICRWSDDAKEQVRQHFRTCIQSKSGPRDEELNKIIYSPEHSAFYEALWESFGKPSEKKLKRTIYDLIRNTMEKTTD
jgi:hypothetical protein